MNPSISTSPSGQPSEHPSASHWPTSQPSESPSLSGSPTHSPVKPLTKTPTKAPTKALISPPTANPTSIPTSPVTACTINHSNGSSNFPVAKPIFCWNGSHLACVSNTESCRTGIASDNACTTTTGTGGGFSCETPSNQVCCKCKNGGSQDYRYKCINPVEACANTC